MNLWKFVLSTKKMVNYILIYTLRSGGPQLVNIVLQLGVPVEGCGVPRGSPFTRHWRLVSHYVQLEELWGIFPVWLSHVLKPLGKSCTHPRFSGTIKNLLTGKQDSAGHLSWSRITVIGTGWRTESSTWVRGRTFILWVTTHLYRLPREIVESPSLATFQSGPEAIVLLVLWGYPAGAGRLEQMTQCGGFQHNPFCDVLTKNDGFLFSLFLGGGWYWHFYTWFPTLKLTYATMIILCITLQMRKC